jgi:hypothetical protein
MRASRNNV